MVVKVKELELERKVLSNKLKERETVIFFLFQRKHDKLARKRISHSSG